MKKPLQISASGGVKILFGVNLGVDSNKQKLHRNFWEENYTIKKKKPLYS